MNLEKRIPSSERKKDMSYYIDQVTDLLLESYSNRGNPIKWAVGYFVKLLMDDENESSNGILRLVLSERKKKKMGKRIGNWDLKNLGAERNCNCVGVDFGTYEFSMGIYLPWNGELATIDMCLHKDIFELWSMGVRTVESCCGHNKIRGYIAVEPEFIGQMKKMGWVEDMRTEASGMFLWPKKTYTVFDEDKDDGGLLIVIVNEDGANILHGAYLEVGGLMELDMLEKRSGVCQVDDIERWKELGHLPKDFKLKDYVVDVR